MKHYWAVREINSRRRAKSAYPHDQGMQIRFIWNTYGSLRVEDIVMQLCYGPRYIPEALNSVNGPLKVLDSV